MLDNALFMDHVISLKYNKHALNKGKLKYIKLTYLEKTDHTYFL